MNIISLLDILEDELEKGASVPFASKAFIDRENAWILLKIFD